MGAKAGDAFIDFHGDFSSLRRRVAAEVAPLTNRFGTLGKAAAVGLGVTAAAAGAAGLALFHVGDEFHRSFSTIRVDTGRTGESLDRLEKSFKKVVSTTPAGTFDEAATTLSALNRRLGLTGKPLENLTVQMLRLSKLTGTDLSGNVDRVTRLFNNWRVASDQQGMALNRLFRLSQATGVGVADLSSIMTKFAAPLRQLHFGFDQSAAMIGGFQRSGLNVTKMMPGLIMALRTFARAGIDPAQGLRRTFNELQHLGKGTKATELAIRTFGARAGIDLATAVEEGRFSYARFLHVMERGRDTINRAASDVSTVSGKLQLLRNRALVLLEPVAMRVFDAINNGLGKVLRWDFGKIITQTQGFRSALSDVGGAVIPVGLAFGGLLVKVSGVLLAFSNTRVGVALLGAAAGALLGRLVALGIAFGVEKIMAFATALRSVGGTIMGTAASMLGMGSSAIAASGAADALKVSMSTTTPQAWGLRGSMTGTAVAMGETTVAAEGAAGATRGLSAAIASTGFGAFVVLAGTVVGALLGISRGNERTQTTVRDLTEALHGEADALRAVRDIDLDVAQRKADVSSANVSVESSERQVTRLRDQGRTRTLAYKQAEADLQQARVQQKRAVRDLRDAEGDAAVRRAGLRQETVKEISTGRSRVETMRQEISTLEVDRERQVRLAEGVRGVGRDTQGMADARKRAAVITDQLATKEGQLHSELERQGVLTDLHRKISQLTDKMHGLDRGTSGYRQTARQLLRTQDQLDSVLRGVPGAVSRASKGFGTLTGTVGGLGGAMGDVSEYTSNTTNRLLQAFGARPLDMSVRAFRLTPGQRFMQALGLQRGGSPSSMTVPGEGSGDKVHLQAMVEPGEEVFVLNRNASEHLRALSSLNHRLPRFQRGGFLGSLVGKANEIDSHHYPYRWGGGHDSNFTPPYDCSGAWSSILHAAGVLGSPIVSGAMMGLGRPGAGAVTVVANPGHVYGLIMGRAWGTSGQNPGGGAGWFDGGIRPGFAVRHIGPQDGEIAVGQLDIGGGTPTMNKMVRGYAERLRGAANRYLGRHVRFGPSGTSGSGSDAVPAGGHFSKRMLMDLWVQAGGPASVANLAAAVALAESGGNPNATNNNTDGSIDRGLWQINSVHGAESTFDIVGNARAAVDISSGGSSWSPWVTYDTGAYRQFLQRGGLLQRLRRGGPIAGAASKHNATYYRNRFGDRYRGFYLWGRYGRGGARWRAGDGSIPAAGRGLSRAQLDQAINSYGATNSLDETNVWASKYTTGDRYQHGGLLQHLQAGGLGRRILRAHRPAGGRHSDPLARRILGALPVFAHGRRRQRSRILRNLLKRISGIGIPRSLAGDISGAETLATMFGDRADYASQLGTTDAAGNDVPGVFGGEGEADWVRGELTQLLKWRNAMVKARTMVQRAMERVRAIIEQVRNRLHDIAQRIIDQGRTKDDLQKALDNLDRDPGDTRRRLQSRLDKLRRDPRRNRADIESTLRQLHALEGDRNTKRKSLRTQIDEITRQQGERVRQRKNLGERILPSLTGRRDSMRDDLDSYSQNLTTVQGTGFGYPYDTVLRALPDLGSSNGLGGTIFAAQIRLRDLLAPRDPGNAVSDSSGGSSGSDTGTSERDSISQDLIDQANKRAYIANKQFDVLKQIPFAGVFHSGGIVPGPVGREALALVQSGERITKVGGGEMPKLIVNGDVITNAKDPFEAVVGDKRFPVVLERIGKEQARRDRYSGRAGVIRR